MTKFEVIDVLQQREQLRIAREALGYLASVNIRHASAVAKDALIRMKALEGEDDVRE